MSELPGWSAQLKRERLKRGWTLRAMSIHLGVKPNSLRLYERGQRPMSQLFIDALRRMGVAIPDDLPPWSRDLRRARQRARLTLAQLGERVGCCRASVGLWEAGQRLPLPEHAASLREVLGVHIPGYDRAYSRSQRVASLRRAERVRACALVEEWGPDHWGGRIRAARLQLWLTTLDISADVGCHRDTLAAIECRPWQPTDVRGWRLIARIQARLDIQLLPLWAHCMPAIRLTLLRVYLDMTQLQVAECAGVAQHHVSRLESLETRIQESQWLGWICEALGIHWEQLFEDEPPMERMR